MTTVDNLYASGDFFMSKILCAFTTLSLASIIVFFGRSPLFLKGSVKEYYLEKGNSSCKIVRYAITEDAYFKLFDIKGEAACGLDRSAVEDIKSKYRAATVFTEEVGNVRSEYLFSEYIPCYKLINGQKVNIHIAYDGQSYKVGSPIIYGGY